MLDQRSLLDQLRALYALANKHGLYDAADFVRGHVEAVERRDVVVGHVAHSATLTEVILSEGAVSALTVGEVKEIA